MVVLIDRRESQIRERYLSENASVDSKSFLCKSSTAQASTWQSLERPSKDPDFKTLERQEAQERRQAT